MTRETPALYQPVLLAPLECSPESLRASRYSATVRPHTRTAASALLPQKGTPLLDNTPKQNGVRLFRVKPRDGRNVHSAAGVPASPGPSRIVAARWSGVHRAVSCPYPRYDADLSFVILLGPARCARRYDFPANVTVGRFAATARRTAKTSKHREPALHRNGSRHQGSVPGCPVWAIQN